MSVDWAEVYRTSFSELVRYLCRKVGDRDHAQDLAHEAFARVLPHAPSHPRAWLFRVAANLARDEVRSATRRKRHLAVLERDAADAVSDEDPAERLDREARKKAAQRALARLGQRDQEILLLWGAGLKYPEIASRMGLAEGAVGTTLARARRKLIAAYRDLEGNP